LIVKILDPGGKEIGHVWFGGDPTDEKWNYDGLVRLGLTISDTEHVVWQVFQRYSDGSYRRIRSYI